jgi:sulfonate transport system substrate-binding protein
MWNEINRGIEMNRCSASREGERENDMNRRKMSIVLMVMVTLVFALSACTSKSNTAKTAQSDSAAGEATENSTSSEGSEDAQESTEDTTTVDLSGVTLRFGATGWELQKELLKAAGLDDTPYKVEYTTFQGGNLCLEAMAANQIDLTGSSEIPPIYASLAENNGNFKIIAISNSNTQLQELILPPDSDIKSVSELKGKRVGYIKSTTAQYFLYQMLKDAGLSWNDIDSVEITTADGVTALLGGELDAFASYGNSINAAKNNGATTLVSAENILSGNFPYEASVTALGDEKLRAAITDYIGRLELAYQWQKEHLEDWAQISADPTGVTYEENLPILQKGFEQRETHVKLITEEVIASEQKVADTFYEIGLLDKQVDVSGLYDDSLSEDISQAIDTLSK